MYRNILFDLDGTLTDPKEGITKSVQYALSSFGIEEPDLQKLEFFIGPPLKEEFMRYCGFDENQALRAVDKYRERFAVTGLYENRVYNGVEFMLKSLKSANRKLAIASSKPTVYVIQILEHFRLSGYFDVIAGSELDGRRSRKSEVVAEALRQLGVSESDRSESVLAGDRKHDIIGARAERIASIGITIGYGGRAELEEAGADSIVDSIEELTELLLKP